MSGDVLLLCICNRFPSSQFIVWTISGTERVNGVFRPQPANAFKAQSSTHMVCILALLEWCVHGIWFPGNSFHWLNQSLFFLRKLPLWHPTTTTNHHLNWVFKMQLVWKIMLVHVRRLRGYLAWYTCPGECSYSLLLGALEASAFPLVEMRPNTQESA